MTADALELGIRGIEDAAAAVNGAKLRGGADRGERVRSRPNGWDWIVERKTRSLGRPALTTYVGERVYKRANLIGT